MAIAFLVTMGVATALTPGPWIKNGRNVMSGFYNMYNPHIIYEAGETYPYKMWFFGWATDVCNPSVGHGCDAIFFARSQSLDGPWQIYKGCDEWDTTGNPCLWKPVLTADGSGGTAGDTIHAGDPSVVKKDGVYYMAFSGMGYDQDGIRSCLPGDTDNDLSVVLAAVSSDGINWTVGSNPIIVQSSQVGAAGSEGASRPSLMWDVDHWRVWFDAPRPSDGALSLYHAENYGDLMDPADWALTQNWDSPQQVNAPNPDVVKVGSTYYCFSDPAGYTPASNPIEGRQVGEYTSSDGLTWTWVGWVAPDADTPADQIPEIYVEAKDGTLWMYCWYAGTLPEASFSEIPADPCVAPDPPLEYTFDRIRYWRRIMDSAVAGNVAPLNNATNVALGVTLEWAAANNPAPTSHNVYFGTSSTPPYVGNTTGTTYSVGTLSYNTTYYWRIDEVGSTTHTGNTWSFTTGPSGVPQQASELYPADHAMQVHVDRDLKWVAGFGATSHDVYFGTSSSPAFIGNQAGVTYDPGTLASATRYYWRIDEKNGSGTTTGAVHSFVTRGGSCPLDPTAGSVPDSYSVDLGSYVSGNMASLAADDGNDFVLASNPSGPYGRHARAAFTFTGINTSSPDCIKVVLAVRSSISDMIYVVYLWNYTLSQWDQKYLASVGTAESSFEFTLDSGSSDYLRCGQMEVQTYGAHASTAFNMTHDVIKIIVPPLDPAAGSVPDSYSVDLGSYVSGNMAGLAADDGNDFVLASNPSGPYGRHARAAFTFTGIASSSPACIKVVLTVRSSISDMTYAAYLWNYTSNNWDIKTLAAVGTGENTFEFTLGSGSSDYLSGGQMKVQTYGAHASTAFNMTHDVIKVIAAP